jgi:hypothetical protein
VGPGLIVARLPAAVRDEHHVYAGSALVGAMLISRAVADPDLSDELLTKVADQLKQLGPRASAPAA